MLLISLIIRFEWPLIRKKFGKNELQIKQINANNHNDDGRVNGLYPSQINKSNLSLQQESVRTVSHTQSPVTSGRNIIDNHHSNNIIQNGHNGHNNNNNKTLHRESAQNTLGIQIVANPTTPSATPTPVPNTPDNLIPKHDDNSNNNQSSQPKISSQQRTSFPNTIKSAMVHPPLDSLPSGSLIGEIQLTQVKSGRGMEIDDEKYVIDNKETGII